VATLVAGGALPTDVFSAVADELARLIGAEASFVSRVDHLLEEGKELDESITVVGSYGRVGDEIPVGFRIRLQPGMIQTAALQTGRPAWVNGEQLAKGPFGASPAGWGCGRRWPRHGRARCPGRSVPDVVSQARPRQVPASR
jgi:hypothetical protein